MNKPFRSSPPRVLDAGAGPPDNARMHPIFKGWTVVRLDINPAAKPDILGSITNLKGKVADGSFDAIWSSHNVEHLFAHEVPLALSEFKRILKPDGFALITCPDLERIGKLITEGDIERTIYKSPAGPITIIDMLFGHSASIARGNTYMAHRTGFTVPRLGTALQKAGFAEAWVAAGPSIDIWAAALMPRTNKATLQEQLAKTTERFLAPAT
jgi:SAM-dependent methyltransferase